MSQLSAKRFDIQTKASPLSTFKELLRWSRNVVCVAPLVGSQLQALFTIAETIVDIVERIHREQEAEIELAKKICATVAIVACALEDYGSRDAPGLLIDLSAIHRAAESVHNIIVLRSKKTFRQRFFSVSSRSDDIMKISSQLDEALAMFQFKCAIQMRVGIQKLSEKLDVLTAREDKRSRSRSRAPSRDGRKSKAITAEGVAAHRRVGNIPQDDGRGRTRTANASGLDSEGHDDWAYECQSMRATRRGNVQRRTDSCEARRKPVSLNRQVDGNKPQREYRIDETRITNVHNGSGELRIPFLARNITSTDPETVSTEPKDRGRSLSTSTLIHHQIEKESRVGLRARSLSPEVIARVTDGARRKAMYVNDWSFVPSPLSTEENSPLHVT